MPDLMDFIKRGLKVLVVCLLGGIIITFFTCNSCRTSTINFAYVTVFCSAVWFTMWIGNWALSEYIGTKISWVDFPAKRLLAGIVTTLVYSVVAVSILLWLFEHTFNFDFGGYLYVMIVTVALTFFISLVLHSKAFLVHWKESAINAEKFEKESIRAQYDSLRNQVNPHFLFNSLNALTNLVYEDQDKAAKFIKQLSDVYRYVLDTREREVVSIEEELKFLSSYIYLQEIRFGVNLVVDMQVSQRAGNIAPLALQLLVENAIKHNVIARDQPLEIRIFINVDHLVVENHLQKKINEDVKLSGLGLENIRKRYSFLTDKKIVIEETNDKFTVRLPILNLLPA